MDTTETPPPPAGPVDKADTNRPWNRSPWLVFVVPYVVYLALTQLEPAPPEPAPLAAAEATDSADAAGTVQEVAAGEAGGDATPGGQETSPEPAASGMLGIEYRHYPLLYTLKIAITFAVMLLALPGYREIPFRVGWLAPVVGAIGAPLWIGLVRLQTSLAPVLGLEGLVGDSARAGFNPLEQLADNPAWAYGFLAIRFFGLAVVVAVIEEFFLRGFLIRFFMGSEWWKVPFGVTTTFPLLVMTAAAVLTHPPAEYLAALVWFSLVSWLMIRTKNIWDCVVAHGVTNLLLGLYVVFSGSWELM